MKRWARQVASYCHTRVCCTCTCTGSVLLLSCSDSEIHDVTDNITSNNNYCVAVDNLVPANLSRTRDLCSIFMSNKSEFVKHWLLLSSFAKIAKEKCENSGIHNSSQRICTYFSEMPSHESKMNGKGPRVASNRQIRYLVNSQFRYSQLLSYQRRNKKCASHNVCVGEEGCDSGDVTGRGGKTKTLKESLASMPFPPRPTEGCILSAWGLRFLLQQQVSS